MNFERILDINIGEEIEDQPLSMPMSLEEEIILTQPLYIDKELILIEEYHQYLKNFLKSRDKIEDADHNLLFPLDLNIKKINESLKKDIIRLFLKILKQLGFSYRTKPFTIIDEEEPKYWVKKNSEIYPVIERLLAFYILVSMKKLSYKLLEILLQIHKQNKDILSREDFLRWNKIIAAYYESK